MWDSQGQSREAIPLVTFPYGRSRLFDGLTDMVYGDSNPITGILGAVSLTPVDHYAQQHGQGSLNVSWVVVRLVVGSAVDDKSMALSGDYRVKESLQECQATTEVSYHSKPLFSSAKILCFAPSPFKPLALLAYFY